MLVWWTLFPTSPRNTIGLKQVGQLVYIWMNVVFNSKKCSVPFDSQWCRHAQAWWWWKDPPSNWTRMLRIEKLWQLPVLKKGKWEAAKHFKESRTSTALLSIPTNFEASTSSLLSATIFVGFTMWKMAGIHHQKVARVNKCCEISWEGGSKRETFCEHLWRRKCNGQQ